MIGAYILIFFLLYAAQYAGFITRATLPAEPWLPAFLCLPVLLGLTNRLMSTLYAKHRQLTTRHMLFATFLVVVVFEVILPHTNARYTSDWGDIFLYLCGALFYCLFLNFDFFDQPFRVTD